MNGIVRLKQRRIFDGSKRRIQIQHNCIIKKNNEKKNEIRTIKKNVYYYLPSDGAAAITIIS